MQEKHFLAQEIHLAVAGKQEFNRELQSRLDWNRCRLQ